MSNRARTAIIRAATTSAALLAWAPTGAHAAPTWTNASGSGSWFSAANWTGNQAPVSGQSPQFNDAGLVNGPTVSLGGGTAQLSFIEFKNTSGGYLLGNGTIVTQTIANANPGASNTIGVDLTYGGGSGALRLTSVPGAPLIVTGTIFEQPGSGPLGLLGTFELRNSSTHRGKTSAFRGSILSGAAGTARLAQEWEVKRGALTLDSAAAAVNDRISDTATMLLRHGALELRGNASSDVTEQIGAVTLSGGENGARVQQPAGAARAALSFVSVTRTMSATLDIDLDGQAQLNVAAPLAGLVGAGGPAGSTNVSILPYVSAGAGLVTQRGAQLLPLAPGEYAPAIPGGASDVNVRLGASQSLASAARVNALIVGDGATLSLTTPDALAITSAALTLDGAGGATGVTGVAGSSVDFGAREGVVRVARAQRVVLDVPLTGTAGLVKSGPGTLVLARDNAVTGSLTINAGPVVSAAQGALPDGDIIVAAPDAVLAFEVDQTVASNIRLRNDAQIQTYTNLTSRTTFEVAAGRTVTLAGAIEGQGFPRFRGPGVIRLTGSLHSGNGAHFDGGTVVADGAISGFTYLNPGGRLEGSGPFAAQLVAETGGGTFAPGPHDQPGAFNMTGSMGLAPGTIFEIELEQSSHDVLRTTTFVSLDFESYQQHPPGPGATLRLVSDDPPFLAFGQQFTIIDNEYAQPVFGWFAGLTEGTRFAALGAEFQITYAGGPTARDVVLTVVPEPASTGLLVMLMGASTTSRALGRRRRGA